MSDEREKIERQKVWLIETINDFIERFQSVKIEIEGTDIDMLDEIQINYLKGLVYGIGSIVNTLKNYMEFIYDGPHEDILNLIDLIIDDKDKGNDEK